MGKFDRVLFYVIAFSVLVEHWGYASENLSVTDYAVMFVMLYLVLRVLVWEPIYAACELYEKIKEPT